MTPSRPWLRYYGKVPHSLSYPEITLYDAVAATAARVPDAIAWDFLDMTASYRAFLADIDTCANALAALGLAAGERILISMPTSAQGVIAFYAANKLGAVPALIHPLSTTPEIEHYLNASRARIAVTLDAFYERFARARPKAPLETLVLARIPDYLTPLKKFGFWLTQGRKIPAVPEGARVRWWADLMAGRHPAAARAAVTTHDPAAILFSGGTTGLPKGILLSNHNFIAEGMQAAAWGGIGEGDSILAALPIFHGFGLGVCVNAAFMAGAKSILVPTFSPEIVAKLLRRKRPNLLFGVPTLYDALARDRSLAKVDLSCLRGAFCGADTLPRPVKERFEKLAAARGARVKLLEGYGLTEAVTAIFATPLEEYRDGSIGIPFPDVLAKICRIGTTEELPPGEEGEICVSGPPVMIGYLDDPEATHETLKVHADGRTWLHTGDLGKMDADGFFFFTLRLKRMIKSSGFNVYPAQVEAVLYQHPLVAEACVAGVPDPSQVERVQAFVVLKDPARAGAETERILIDHCREHLIKWSCPRQVEFLRELPKTRVGKIDYKLLVQQYVAALGTRDRPQVQPQATVAHGGDRVAAALAAHGTRFVFTLCGGHISPILTASKARGWRVIDVRDEATAVFAADAVARLTGVPGVAVVTAGPGLTNSITALKNAQLAQSPVILLGGAAPTALQGRGALQDIDQQSLIAPHVKLFTKVRRVRDLGPAVEKAFAVARAGVPGPVFIECPVDLLYDEASVRGWYAGAAGKGTALADRLRRFYLNRHVERLFTGSTVTAPPAARPALPPVVSDSTVRAAAAALSRAERPLLVVGSQALARAGDAPHIAAAVARLGIPVYLAGMARGLLGRDHALHMRHQRRQALREADCVVLAGAPCDFRLDYGRHVRRSATLVAANRSAKEARMNRRPDVAAIGDAGLFLELLAEPLARAGRCWTSWIEALRARDLEREAAIDEQARHEGEWVNPIAFFRMLDRHAGENAVIVADGGDFVATASYIVHARAPLSWLDPGVFGTLGVGAGFALGAALCRPEAEIWIIYGDGACGYSLIEFDTFARHGIPVIAVVGNDGGWSQIAREQVKMLHDDVATVLGRGAYHLAAAGLGAEGILVQKTAEVPMALARARELARSGKPVLINVWLDKTDFREGSISM